MIGNSVSQNLRYCVIHGHFYQPPRENPWLDIIEHQPSADPCHDWNERVYEECYRPNAYSRLLDPHGQIIDINNNYRSLSFNFGPTLLSWLEKRHPDVVDRIISADKESCARLGGHGNAVAQVYNHIIMPLASRKDQLTQIRWAKSFFKRHFSRDPEGIWLAETGINMETVRCLIEEGIRYTILAPSQAEAFRPLDHSDPLVNTAQQGIDPRRSYRVFATDEYGKTTGEHIDVFFFNESLSRNISFGGILNDANTLAAEIASNYDTEVPGNQSVVIATDGETFGHHKAFGDMCLAYFFRTAAAEHKLVPVNFGYLLSVEPPRFEATLKNAWSEGTAWSCAHGVGRWIRDCGCSTGGQSGWNQQWRGPLRQAFVNIQKSVDLEYAQTVESLGADPVSLRDDYEPFFEEEKTEPVVRYLSQHIALELLTPENIKLLRRLLAAQRYMLYSFTSCGWFFTEVTGIETVQNIAYGYRALQLGLPHQTHEYATHLFSTDLAGALSNFPGQSGATALAQHVIPFSQHTVLLAFGICVEKIVSKGTTLTTSTFGIMCSLQPLMRRDLNGMTYESFSVAIHNPKTGEEKALGVLIMHKRGGDLCGWVLDKEIIEETPALVATPSSWIAHPSAVALSLANLFAETKLALSGYFKTRVAHNTGRFYSAWLMNNQSWLDALVALDNRLPSSLTGPVEYVLNAQWNQKINETIEKKSSQKFLNDLSGLLGTAQKFGVTIDRTYASQVLQTSLTQSLFDLTAGATKELCDTIAFHLTIADRFGIPIKKHALEDIFYPVRQSTIRSLYARYQSGIAHADEIAMLEHLLDFAHRINFATGEFPFTPPLQAKL